MTFCLAHNREFLLFLYGNGSKRDIQINAIMIITVTTKPGNHETHGSQTSARQCVQEVRCVSTPNWPCLCTYCSTPWWRQVNTYSSSSKCLFFDHGHSQMSVFGMVCTTVRGAVSQKNRGCTELDGQMCRRSCRTVPPAGAAGCLCASVALFSCNLRTSDIAQTMTDSESEFLPGEVRMRLHVLKMLHQTEMGDIMREPCFFTSFSAHLHKVQLLAHDRTTGTRHY